MSEVIYSNEEIDGAISILNQLLIECEQGDLDQHVSPALIIARDGLRQLAAAQRRIAELEQKYGTSPIERAAPAVVAELDRMKD